MRVVFLLLPCLIWLGGNAQIYSDIIIEGDIVPQNKTVKAYNEFYRDIALAADNEDVAELQKLLSAEYMLIQVSSRKVDTAHVYPPVLKHLSHIWKKDYRKILEDIELMVRIDELYEERKYNNWFQLYHMATKYPTLKVQKFLKEKQEEFEQDVKNDSSLSLDEKSFLVAYIEFLIYAERLCFYDKALLHEKLKDFLQIYPNSKLAHYAEMYLYPGYKERKWGYGTLIGLSSTVYTDNNAEYFTPFFNADLGLNFIVHGVDINFNGQIGYFSKYQKDSVSSKASWEHNSTMLNKGFSITMGYQVFSNENIAISPFIGTGIEYVQALGGGFGIFNTEKQIGSEWEYIAGLSFDVKFEQNTCDNYSMNDKEIVFNQLRFRLMYKEVDFLKHLPDGKSGAIMLGVSFGQTAFEARNVRYVPIE